MNFKSCLLCCNAVLCGVLLSVKSYAASQAKTYYISNSGSDNNTGTIKYPFKTIQKANTLHFYPDDVLAFKSGEVFKGSLKIDSGNSGNKLHPVIIRSYGKGRAIIDADSVSAISVYKSSYINITNLILKGIGRKSGNYKAGLNLINSNYIKVKGIEISGFQKAGLLVHVSSHITINNVNAHDNGYAGISLEGSYGKRNTIDVKVTNCRAENNPGDPTELNNHSGNGIVAGYCKNILIDHCTANNNGWDMPRVGNGPVGIWAYESDNVIIQYSLAYQNKTAKGADDGGGFDFDGGVTNSVVQYCVSYGNQGAGYCMFQYTGASPWHHNIFRYNIGENDGMVSPAQAGIYVWNSSEDANQFYDCQFYGNIIYNSKRAALSFSNPNQNKDFHYYNNIFVGRDKIIIGKDSLKLSEYTGNDWWSLKSGFNIDGIKSLKQWAHTSGKETKSGKIIGLNISPQFKNPGKTRIISASQIKTYTNYQLSAGSILKKKLKLLQLQSN